MRYLKRYKLFENYLNIDDFKEKESDKIENVFQDLSDIMVNWEDQGIETKYKLITNPREYLTYIIAEFNDEIEFKTYTSKDLEKNLIESLDKGEFWYKLSFGFDIYNIKGTMDIDFDKPDIIEYPTKLKECYDEVYNRILVAFNPKDIHTEVFNPSEINWYKIHDHSNLKNNYKYNFKYEITFKI